MAWIGIAFYGALAVGGAIGVLIAKNFGFVGVAAGVIFLPLIAMLALRFAGASPIPIGKRPPFLQGARSSAVAWNRSCAGDSGIWSNSNLRGSTLFQPWMDRHSCSVGSPRPFAHGFPGSAAAAGGHYSLILFANNSITLLARLQQWIYSEVRCFEPLPVFD